MEKKKVLKLDNKSTNSLKEVLEEDKPKSINNEPLIRHITIRDKKYIDRYNLLRRINKEISNVDIFKAGIDYYLNYNSIFLLKKIDNNIHIQKIFREDIYNKNGKMFTLEMIIKILNINYDNILVQNLIKLEPYESLIVKI